MNCKAKGSRAERRAVKVLESLGYVCTKAGGSLGLFDIVAVGAEDVRLIQVKSGTARLSRAERAAIVALTVPGNVTREYWRFPTHRRRPLVELLGLA
jgi:Holliday junction resolvase